MSEFGPDPNLEYVDRAQAHQFRVEEAARARKIAHEAHGDGTGRLRHVLLAVLAVSVVLGVVGAIYLLAVP